MRKYKIIGERTRESTEYTFYENGRLMVILDNLDGEGFFVGRDLRKNDFLTEVAKKQREILDNNPKIKTIETKLIL